MHQWSFEIGQEISLPPCIWLSLVSDIGLHKRTASLQPKSAVECSIYIDMEVQTNKGFDNGKISISKRSEPVYSRFFHYRSEATQNLVKHFSFIQLHCIESKRTLCMVYSKT